MKTKLNKYLKSLVWLLLFLSINAQANYLKTKITLSLENKPINYVLHEIENQSQILFSYNSNILNADSLVSIKAKNESLKRVLNKLFDNRFEFKLLGNHIVLFRNEREKPQKNNSKEERSYVIQGYIIDKRSGETLEKVTIYDVGNEYTTISDSTGRFSIKYTNEFTYKSLNISKKGYLDTIIIVKPEKKIKVELESKPQKNHIHKAESKSDYIKVSNDVNDMELVNFVVPDEVLTNSENMPGKYVNHVWQISLLPFAGTHFANSGLYVNNLSFNILAGYAGGVKGVEVGGLLNINKMYVDGVQLSGLGNINGGNMSGVQYSGVFNYNGGSTKGFQASGIINTSAKAVEGVQAAGIINVSNDSLSGIQASGVSNYHGGNLYGIQTAGITNFCKDSLYGVQAAGIYNYSGSEHNGIQVAGITNTSRGVLNGIQAGGISCSSDTLRGIQASGFSNYNNSELSGIQASGFSNISRGIVRGIQISPFYNYAKIQKGLQFGLINISDSIKGLSLGLLTYAHHGFHKLELYYSDVFYINAAFKSGAKHFHNIYKFSLINNGKQMWAFGFGFGTNFTIYKKLGFEMEYTANQVVEQKEWVNGVNLLNSFEAALNLSLTKNFCLFAGPTMNIHISNLKNNDTGEFTTSIANNPVVTHKTADFQSQIWFGYKFGIRF